MGDDFSDENSGESTEKKEVKEGSEEEQDENDTQSDSSTDKNYTDEDDADEGGEAAGDDNNKGEVKSEEDKVKALEGLRQTETELGNDVSNLDKEIETRRQRITQLRKERRDRKDIINTIDTKIPDAKEDDLSDIDPESLKIVERVIKAKGYVSRDELGSITFEQQQKDAQTTFFEKHAEYLPENDKDDFLYNELKKELALYAKPSDPKLISQIYERAHKAVRDKFPTYFKTTNSVNLSDQKKNIVRNQGAGTGGGASSGGGSSAGSSKEGKLSPMQIEHLRAGGWTEEDIARLNSK